MIALAFAVALLGQLAPCQPVDTDRVLGRHLASALPQFAALPPDLDLGYAPVPGARRSFSVMELQRLAVANGMDATFSAPVCFAWPLAPVTPAAMRTAMLRALEPATARIDVLEVSAFAAPLGEVIFLRSALPPPSLLPQSDSLLWKGFVKYGGSRQFTIWARVRVAMPCVRVVAVEPIRAGEPIRAEQVRVEEYEGLPAAAVANDLSTVVGNCSRRALAAGSAVLRANLEPPLDVKKGDAVAVEVVSGATRFRFEAKAEESGRRGATIRLRNQSSGKIFQAQIVERGKANLQVATREAM